MEETRQRVNEIYLSELIDAIRQLTHAYAMYSTVITRQKAKGKANENLPETIESYLTTIITYEQHAWLRLNAIKETSHIDLETIEKCRETLKEIVPKEQDLFSLILEYQKFSAKHLTSDLLRSPEEKMGELTGKI